MTHDRDNKTDKPCNPDKAREKAKAELMQARPAFDYMLNWQHEGDDVRAILMLAAVRVPGRGDAYALTADGNISDIIAGLIQGLHDRLAPAEWKAAVRLMERIIEHYDAENTDKNRTGC